MRSDCRNDLPLACMKGVTPGQVFAEAIGTVDYEKLVRGEHAMA